jgi:hypothetical protein
MCFPLSAVHSERHLGSEGIMWEGGMLGTMISLPSLYFILEILRTAKNFQERNDAI